MRAADRFARTGQFHIAGRLGLVKFLAIDQTIRLDVSISTPHVPIALRYSFNAGCAINSVCDYIGGLSFRGEY